AVRLQPRRRALRGAPAPGRARRLLDRRGAPRRRDREPGRTLPGVALARPLSPRANGVRLKSDPAPTWEEPNVATNTLSILKPSVNNLSTRIFVRAAGL